MKTQKTWSSVIGIFLITSVLIACAKSSDSDSSSGPQKPQVFRRSYSFDDNGCVAAQEVTASTQAEADQKICEAAADDAKNNFCAGYRRDLFLIQNCDIRRTTPQPTPETPTEKVEPWTSSEKREFDSNMRNITLRAYVKSEASQSAKVVASRIANCGVSSEGPTCLDAIRVFGNVETLKDKDGYKMKFTFIPSSEVFILRLDGAEFSILLDNVVVATIVELKDPSGLSDYYSDYIDFYHSAKRALDKANREAESDRHLTCPKCADLVDLQLRYEKLLNERPEVIVGKGNSDYEYGLIRLAFDNDLRVESLKPFIEALSTRGVVSEFGKALVLFQHPERVELKRDVIDWVNNSMDLHRGIGMEAIGRTSMTRQDEFFVISWLTGIPGVRLEAEKIVERMQLSDEHIDAILKGAPLDLTVRYMVKIKTLKSVGVLARLLKDNTPRPYRILAARGLVELKSLSNGLEILKAARDAIEGQKLVEKDEAVLKALNGDE